MRNTLLAAALAAAVMLPQAASAQVIITSWTPDPGYLTASTMNYTPTGFVGANPGLSRFHLTGTENGTVVEFFSYCIDAFSSLTTGSFEWADISVLLDEPSRQQQLLTLLTNSELLLGAESDTLMRKTISAATQLAVWEIVSEGQDNPYDTSGGEFFTVGGNSDDARALANSYLAQIADGSWTAVAGRKLRLLFSADNQSQVLVTAVPEPATWLTMIGGFAFVGGALRRRRSAALRLA
jgi:Thioester domain